MPALKLREYLRGQHDTLCTHVLLWTPVTGRPNDRAIRSTLDCNQCPPAATPLIKIHFSSSCLGNRPRSTVDSTRAFVPFNSQSQRSLFIATKDRTYTTKLSTPKGAGHTKNNGIDKQKASWVKMRNMWTMRQNKFLGLGYSSSKPRELKGVIGQTMKGRYLICATNRIMSVQTSLQGLEV